MAHAILGLNGLLFLYIRLLWPPQSLQIFQTHLALNILIVHPGMSFTNLYYIVNSFTALFILPLVGEKKQQNHPENQGCPGPQAGAASLPKSYHVPQVLSANLLLQFALSSSKRAEVLKYFEENSCTYRSTKLQSILFGTYKLCELVGVVGFVW